MKAAIKPLLSVVINRRIAKSCNYIAAAAVCESALPQRRPLAA
jgi:hypothetical protein